MIIITKFGASTMVNECEVRPIASSLEEKFGKLPYNIWSS